MNILFTGGTGLIGSAFIQHFAKQHQFTVLTRRPDNAARMLGSRIRPITRLSSLENLNSFDAIINLAGEPIADKRWTDARKARLEQSRWNITNELATLVNNSERPPQVFISGSAVGYYGRQSSTPISESSHQVHQEYSHRLCRIWEETAQACAANTRLCIVRTGIVLAANGGALTRMLPPFKLGLGGPIGSGKQMMSWIQLDDMVNLLAHLLQQPQCQGAYNATAPMPVSNKEFSQTLAKVLRRPCLFKVPAFVLRAAFGEMADLILTGQAVLPERLQQSGFSFQYTTLEQALRHTLTQVSN